MDESKEQTKVDYVNSILNSVKKSLGLVEYDFFDSDLIMHINSVFSDLAQIGVGPKDGFSISDSNATWSSYLTDNFNLLQNVKSYMFLKVKLLFDPPTNSSVLKSYQDQINEFTYRMYVTTDNINNKVDANSEGDK
jgi:hypothetical protein